MLNWWFDVAEVASSKECYTFLEWKTRFAHGSWRQTTHLRNSVLWIPPHLASPFSTVGHHFSALRSSSQTISALLNSSHNSSQLFSIFFISSHLSSTLFTSSNLFLTLLNDSHLCLTLLSSFTSAQLISTLLTSCQLFSPFYLFSQRCFTRTNFYQGSFYTRIFLHREAFTQRSFQVHNGSRNCSSKTGSRRQSEKDDFGALFKMNFTRKTTSAKMEKSLLPNHHRNLDAATPLRSAKSFCGLPHKNAEHSVTASTSEQRKNHPEFEQNEDVLDDMGTGPNLGPTPRWETRIRKKNSENTQEFQLGGFVFWFS